MSKNNFEENLSFFELLAISPSNWARYSLIKAIAEQAERKSLERLQEHGKFHRQLASSFLETESALISFANALASVKGKCSIDPLDANWSLIRESEIRGDLTAFLGKHFYDESKIYGQPLGHSVLPWLRIAEELPNWRKELAKKAFNVKYHG
ncbi:hypothetical protein BN1088_1431251 [Sphingobacterium sp. PM2-P1-29]|nr:hypothetical protein BN1088_1431251 [Sphingobacterium sp. PM2-P1-29]